MKKGVWVLGIMLVLLVMSISGCGGNPKQELNPAFNEETLKKSATEIIQLWNDKNIEGMLANADEGMKTPTIQEYLDVWEQYMPKLGAFKEIKKQEIGPNGQSAIMVVVVEYENGKAIYTIGFDQQMKLNNFFIK